MNIMLKIIIWNVNGLQYRIQEFKVFLFTDKIDIIHIAEAYLAIKDYVKIPFYNIYDA